mgnify:FL=1
MDLQRFCIKVFARPSPQFDDEALIPIFHEWIRDGVPLGTLIDVTDYRHVPHGPGVMLIAHEANFAVDRAEGGRLGLLYQRKTVYPAAELHRRILGAAQQAVAAAQRLASDVRLEGNLAFDAGALRFIANDRLLAPNTEEAYGTLVPQLRRAAEALYGECELRPAAPDPRDRLAVDVIGRGASASLESLAERLRTAV